jgi:hypothetical protein
MKNGNAGIPCRIPPGLASVQDVDHAHEQPSYVRIVIAGSIRAARSAGIQHAAMPIAAIITATAANVTGS